MQYKHYTLDEWQWKTSVNAKFSGSSGTAAMNSDQVDTLQLSMRNIIKNNPDDLGIFGSFYFIMEARGIEQHTNCVIDVDEMNPYEILHAKVP